MKVYFSTHATTTDNETGLASGWKDVELSELGMQQAQGLSEYFKNIPIYLIYCSDFKRSHDTATIAFGDRLPILVDQRLREINYGDFNGKPKDSFNKADYINSPFPHGESYKDAVAQLHDFYRELKQKYDSKTVLIVGHQTTHFGLDTLVDGKTIEQCLAVPFKWQPYWEYEL